MPSKIHYLIFSTLFGALCGAQASSQEGAIVGSRISNASDVRAIASITTADYSGAFVAEPSGAIYLDQLKDGQVASRKTIRSGGGANSFRPVGLAYADSRLYAYDGVTRRFLAAAAPAFDHWEPQIYGTQLHQPSHIAVSPHGLVAVIDNGRLIFLQHEHEPVVYERSEFRQPAGLGFTAWNTLNVLDRQRGSLVTIVFSRYRDGAIKFLEESETKAGLPEGQAWRAMDVHDGVTYLATTNNVYAFVESTLIPVMYRNRRVNGIIDFVITSDSLALTAGSSYQVLPRAVPVDLSFESGASASQSALLAYYGYLDSRHLLPVRRVRARTEYRTVEEFLFDQDAIITPRSHSAERIQVVSDEQKYAYTQASVDIKAKPGARMARIEQAAVRSARDLVCRLNRGYCAADETMGVGQDQELVIPDIAIRRTLSRELIELERPLGSYLNDLVFSPQLRRLIDADVLRRLNPDISTLSDEEILGLAKGEVQIPVERWALSAAVPHAEFTSSDSELWRITAQDQGVFLRPLASFVVQAAKSMPHEGTAHADEAAGTDPCQTLSQARKSWWQHIRYPVSRNSGEPLLPWLRNSPVRVGVLEFGSTVLASHQVFSLDSNRPVWHQFNALAELEPDPAPQTFTLSEQSITNAEFYSPEAHHGTHVAALIAGRAGRCWSGLLPSARLILIDLNSRSDLQRKVDNGVKEGVKVLNASQEFSQAQDVLDATIQQESRVLWVVAAGNEGLDLDGAAESSVPAPARWGQRPNVVAVTASDWNGVILEDVDTEQGLRKGANRGKRYVDLVAPGQDVYSATEQHMFGRASGTSQAVPQVTAAAALLADQLGAHLMPGDVKARLIATADWVPAYKGKVWGGRLDFGAAVMFPDRDLIRTVTGAQLNRWHAIVSSDDPKIAIVNVPHYYERDTPQGASAPDTIRFSHILSLRRQPDDTFRVVMRESGTDKLKILLDAKLADDTRFGRSQLIHCSDYEVLDANTGALAPDNGCDQGLSVTTIDTYVKGKAYQVRWGN